MERDDTDDTLDDDSEDDGRLARVSLAARDATAELEPASDFTDRTMSAVRHVRRETDAADDPFADVWASIADRTDALAPRSDLTSRIMNAVRGAAADVMDVDPLERIALRTERLDASPGFDERVMKRVRGSARARGATSRPDERYAVATREGLAKNGVRALFAAAAVAAAAMIYAGVSERNLDADVLANVDPIDMGE
jgi:hypothetical protein